MEQATAQLHGIVVSPAGQQMLINGHITIEELVGWPHPIPGPLDVPLIVDRRFYRNDAEAFTDFEEWLARCQEQEVWDNAHPGVAQA